MLITALLLAIAPIVLLPSAILLLECSAACLARPERTPLAPNHRSRTPEGFGVAVLVPAHNEASVIAETLQSIQPQLAPQDILIVVADNCTDATAAIARKEGATVIERIDQEKRGKGYALDFGVQYLAQHQQPDIVILMDADCYGHAGCIEQLTNMAVQQQRPIQGCYVMATPAEPSIKDRLSAFAFLVKNWVRPLGLSQLGAPCLLTGTGMAFPWPILRDAPLASSNIVEDMQLGLDLAIAGHAPLFCPTARVTGLLPQAQDTATQQRTRWEHGHLQTFLSQTPRLLKAAIKQHRLDLLALVGELTIPPISFLVLLWLAYALISLLTWLAIADYRPLLLTAIAGAMLGMAILLAWAKAARELLPFTTLLMTPLYLLWKIPLYLKFFRKPQANWNKTERDSVIDKRD
ncbi:glycosyltransferase family 2 protein [Synechocystis salina LEGE 06155]|nr:glycosyltransferase family 2 protein [Synechocystis salina LEGE 06155]